MAYKKDDNGGQVASAPSASNSGGGKVTAGGSYSKSSASGSSGSAKASTKASTKVTSKSYGAGSRDSSAHAAASADRAVAAGRGKVASFTPSVRGGSSGGGLGFSSAQGADPTQWGNASANYLGTDKDVWNKGADLPYDYEDRNLHYFDTDHDTNKSHLEKATEWNVNRSKYMLGQYWDSGKKQYESETARREDNGQWLKDAQIYHDWAEKHGYDDLANQWEEAYNDARYKADFGFYLDTPEAWDSILTDQKTAQAQKMLEAAETDEDRERWQRTLDDLGMTSLTGSALTEARIKKAQENADSAESESEARRWSKEIKTLQAQLKEEKKREKKENSFLGKAEDFFTAPEKEQVEYTPEEQKGRETLEGEYNRLKAQYQEASAYATDPAQLQELDGMKAQLDALEQQIKDDNRAHGREVYDGLGADTRAADAFEGWAGGRAANVGAVAGTILNWVDSASDDMVRYEYDQEHGEGAWDRAVKANPELENYLDLGETGNRLMEGAQANKVASDQLWSDYQEDMSDFGKLSSNVVRGGADLALNAAENAFVPGSGAFSMYMQAAGGGALEQAGRENNDPDSVAAAAVVRGVGAWFSNRLVGGVEAVYGKSVLGGIADNLIKGASPAAQKTIKTLLNSEGIEEGLEDMLNYAADRILGLDGDASLDWNEVKQDAMIGYILGVLTNGLAGGMNYDQAARHRIVDGGIEAAESGLAPQEIERIARESTKEDVVIKPGNAETSQETENVTSQDTGVSSQVTPEQATEMAQSQTAALEGQGTSPQAAPAQTQAVSDAEVNDIINEVNSWGDNETNAEMAGSQSATLAGQDTNPVPAPNGGTPAQQDVIDILMNPTGENGTISNSQAKTILGNPELLEAFEQLTGTTPETGSNSAARNSVKDAGAKFVSDWEVGQEARGRARASMEIDDIIDEVMGWSSGKTQPNIDNAANVEYNNLNNADSGVNANDATGSVGKNQGGIPGVREAGGAGLEGRNGPNGTSVGSGIVLLSDEAKATLNGRGVEAVDLQDQSADTAAFSAALDAARSADQLHGWAVTPKTVEDLSAPGMKVMMAANGTAGLAVAPDGDIEAVFANKSAGAPKGVTKSTIPQAIANGGTKLDCYGAGLVKLYSQYGFIPVARVKFNPEYANPGWDASKGNPDIYFMMHNGDSSDTVVQKHGQYPEFSAEQLASLPEMKYDDAYAYRDSLLEQQIGEASNAETFEENPFGIGTEPEATSEPAAESATVTQENPTEVNSQSEETNAPETVLNAHETAGNANTEQNGTGTRRTVTDNARTNENTDADFDALVAKNGAIEQGEKPARDISVPKKDASGNKVGEGLRTIMEAEATPESRLGNLKAAVINGDFGHVPVTNDTRSRNAAAKIAKDGWKKSVGDFLGAVSSGKSDADTIALGAHLLNEAGNSPEATGRDYVELAMAYNEAMTRAGQGLVAGRILKTLTPEGKLYGFEKTVEKINKDIRQKNEKRAPARQKPEVKLNEKLVQDFLNAKTDAERDAVHDKMVKDVAQQVPNTLRDKFTALRYLNMLGNLKTQVRNVVGNVGMSAAQKVKNEVVSAIEGIASTASGGKYERQYKGFYGTDLLRTARADFGSDEMLQKAAKGEAKYSDVGKQAMADIQDAKDPFSNKWAVGKFLNLYSKITNAAMEYGDLVFVRANYADALAGYLNAHNISSAQWEAMVSDPDRAADVDKARNYAIKQAQEATFRDTNAVSKFVSTMDKDFPRLAKAITQGVIPFRKTPANVLVRMEEYSPLGLVNTAVNGVRAARGEASASDVIDSMAKTITGTGLAALGFFLRSKGWVRTKDKDDKEEALAKLRGSQDYSVEFTLPNGKRKSFTLDWLTPASGSFFMGSELFDIVDEGGITPANAMTVLSSFTNPMLEMSMLSGVNDALSNLSDFNGDNSAMAQFVLNSAWSYLTQGISNTLAGQAEQFNEAYRQTYYTDSDNPFLPTSVQKKIAKLGNKTPLKDYQAADYIDAWGRKQKNDENLWTRAFNVFANPGYVSNMDEKTTEVDDLLAGLYQFGKTQTERDDFPDVVPKTPSRSTTVNGEKLTPEEYDLYATTKGREALDAVTEFSKSDTFRNMDKFAQAETISDIYSYSAFLAASRIAESRGEAYYDDKYSPLIRGVDKNGDETYKASVKRGDVPEYLAFKNAYDSAMDKKDYDAIDALLDSADRLPASAMEGAMDRENKMETLMELKDAGLSSADVYYQFQDDMKNIYEGEKRTAPKSSDYIRAAGSGRYSPQDADAIMNYETTASEKTVAKYQDQVRYNLEMAGMGGNYSEVWHMVQSVADGDMTKDQLKSYVERNLPIEYRQAIRDVASNYAEDRHVAGKTVSGIYKAAREAGATPKEALEFYNMIDTNYNGYYTKKEFDAACRQMFGTGETGRQVRAALQDYVGK